MRFVSMIGGLGGGILKGGYSTVLGADLLHFTLSHFVLFFSPDSVLLELGKSNDTAR